MNDKSIFTREDIRLVNITGSIIFIGLTILDAYLRSIYGTGTISSTLPFGIFMGVLAIIILGGQTINLILPMVLFFDLLLPFFINILSKTSNIGFLNILIIIKTIPYWIVFAIIYYTYDYFKALRLNELEGLEKWSFLIIVLIMFLFLFPQFRSITYLKQYQNTNTYMLAKQKEFVQSTLKQAKEVTNETYTYWGSWFYCMRKVNPLQLNDCIDRRINPDKYLTGDIDPYSIKTYLLEIDPLNKFQTYEYQDNLNKKIRIDNLIVGANTKNEMNVDITCEIGNDKSFEKIPTFEGSEKKSTIKFEKRNELIPKDHTITCIPDKVLNPKNYNIKFTAKTTGLSSFAKKTDFFINEKILETEEDNLLKQENIRNTYYSLLKSDKNQAKKYLWEQIYSFVLNKYYPDKSYKSKSKPGFIKTIIQTYEDYPPIHPTTELFPITVAIENLEENGKILNITEVKITVPDFLTILDHPDLEGNNPYYLKKLDKFDFSKLEKNKQKILINALGKIGDDTYSDKSFSQLQASDFEIEITYNYQLEKKYDINILSAQSIPLTCNNYIVDPNNKISDTYKGRYEKYKSTIESSAKTYNTDPAMIASIAQQESSMGDNDKAFKVTNRTKSSLTGCGWTDSKTKNNFNGTNPAGASPETQIDCTAKTIADGFKGKGSDPDYKKCPEKTNIEEKWKCVLEIYNQGKEGTSNGQDYANKVWNSYIKWKNYICSNQVTV